MIANCVHLLSPGKLLLRPSACNGFTGFPALLDARGSTRRRGLNGSKRRSSCNGAKTSSGSSGVVCGLLPVDPWAPNIDSQSVASQLFAVSLFPYLGFLYYITRSKTAPRLTLFGFYFLLAFVGATIPAGIYAKLHYGTSLSNVDWLHGSAESLLTLTNLFIVLGLREALRNAKGAKKSTNQVVSEVKEKSSV